MNGCRSRWNFTNITNPVEGVSVKNEFIVFLGNHLKYRSNCSLAVCNYFSDEHYDNFHWNIYSSSFFCDSYHVLYQFNWIKTPNFWCSISKFVPFTHQNTRIFHYLWKTIKSLFHKHLRKIKIKDCSVHIYLVHVYVWNPYTTANCWLLIIIANC